MARQTECQSSKKIRQNYLEIHGKNQRVRTANSKETKKERLVLVVS